MVLFFSQIWRDQSFDVGLLECLSNIPMTAPSKFYKLVQNGANLMELIHGTFQTYPRFFQKFMLGLLVIFLVIDMNSLEKTSLRRGEVGKRGEKDMLLSYFLWVTRSNNSTIASYAFLLS